MCLYELLHDNLEGKVTVITSLPMFPRDSTSVKRKRARSHN